MARELGGSQISALLESVPGIRSVLRSPVADALVQMIRAGAGLDAFRMDSAAELVQYSVRRGLISGDEGDELMAEVTAVAGRRRGRSKPAAKKPARKAKPAKKTAKKPSKKPVKKPAKKAAKRPAAKKQPAKKKAAKKAAPKSSRKPVTRPRKKR
jgi:hypothetical protein